MWIDTIFSACNPPALQNFLSTLIRPSDAAAHGNLFGTMPEERPMPMNIPKARCIISVPVSPEQKAELERRAGRRPISAYARDTLFPANDNTPVKPRGSGRAPNKDRASMAAALAKIGQSDVAQNLRALTHLAKIGALPISPETEAALIKASADIADIKAHFMKALGIRED